MRTVEVWLHKTYTIDFLRELDTISFSEKAQILQGITIPYISPDIHNAIYEIAKKLLEYEKVNLFGPKSPLASH